MPWKDTRPMLEREAFVQMVDTSPLPFWAICRQFGISAPTGYKWWRRTAEPGRDQLADRSRTPHTQPRRTAAEIEARVCALRLRHPAWGGREIAAAPAGRRRRARGIDDHQHPAPRGPAASRDADAARLGAL
ncbi:MAG: leucine zipper domain-containing protein [Chloroflexota bacterium]|nr:leucine zipper domain-containing protein [Chloroflexota bacterium]